jgi:hypothetical protein
LEAGQTFRSGTEELYRVYVRAPKRTLKMRDNEQTLRSGTEVLYLPTVHLITAKSRKREHQQETWDNEQTAIIIYHNSTHVCSRYHTVHTRIIDKGNGTTVAQFE